MCREIYIRKIVMIRVHRYELMVNSVWYTVSVRVEAGNALRVCVMYMCVKS